MLVFDTQKLSWINEPTTYSIDQSHIFIRTEPDTDIWQRTFPGFRHDNAPALLLTTDEQNFAFSVRVNFRTSANNDQCGIIIYQDPDNWANAGIENESDTVQKLGCVVTNHGFSDWSSVDIAGDVHQMSYRISRKGSDFKIENAADGIHYQQMRVFHLHNAQDIIRFGVFACSPTHASFDAHFSDFKIEPCNWIE